MCIVMCVFAVSFFTGDSFRSTNERIKSKWMDLSAKSDNRTLQPDDISYHYFFGYIDGVTGTESPLWWRMALSLSHIENGQLRNRIQFNKKDNKYHITNDSDNAQAFIEYPAFYKATYDHGTIVIKDVNVKINAVDNGISSDSLQGIQFCSLIEHNDKIYTVVYGSHSRRMIICYDKKGSKVLWHKDAGNLSVAPQGIGGSGSSGPSVNIVTIATSKDSVSVYGYCNQGMYLETYNCYSGCNQIHHTAYYK